jgi:hypothetical protein
MRGRGILCLYGKVLLLICYLFYFDAEAVSGDNYLIEADRKSSNFEFFFNDDSLDDQVVNYCRLYSVDEVQCALLKLATVSLYYYKFQNDDIDASDTWRIAQRSGFDSVFSNKNNMLMVEAKVYVTGMNNSVMLKLLRNEFTLDEQVSQFCISYIINPVSCQTLKMHMYDTYRVWLENGGVDEASRVLQLPGVNAYPSRVLTVHTIGDSHSLWDFDMFDTLLSNPHINTKIKLNVNSLGPKLMNSVGRDGIVMPYQKYFASQLIAGDVIVFAFGEIDVRCHVHKFVGKTGVVHVIRRLVTNYFASVVKWIAGLPVSVHVWIQGLPPPAVIQDMNYDNFPVAGSLSERTLYVSLMNHYLEKHSLRLGYAFLDMFDEYVSDWGVLKDEHIKAYVHVGNYSGATKAFVSETISQYIINT